MTPPLPPSAELARLLKDLRLAYQRALPADPSEWSREERGGFEAVANVSELYRRGRGFAEHLMQDAEAVRTWLGDAPTPARLAVEK